MLGIITASTEALDMRGSTTNLPIAKDPLPGLCTRSGTAVAQRVSLVVNWDISPQEPLQNQLEINPSCN